MRISDWSSDVCSSDLKYEREGEDFDFTKPITINGHLYAPVGPMTPGAALGLGKLPREMVAAEPGPLAELVHARNWLISAEGLIAEASAFIRGVTGANPGCVSEALCKRVHASLQPLAEMTPLTAKELAVARKGK